MIQSFHWHLGALLIICFAHQPTAQAASTQPEPAYPSSTSYLSQSVPNSDRPQSIPPVFQLSDVQPTDWAFEALQSLAKYYSCLTGYTDGSFLGNQPLTRYEFAAGLEACLTKLSQLTAAQLSGGDQTKLLRLQREFAAELALLRGRTDGVEAQLRDLEVTQFSTTTKLTSEMLYQLGDSFGDRVEGEGDDSQTFFGYRVRLDFATSFTGRDLLRTRLEARDISRLDEVTGTAMTRLGTDGDTDEALNLELAYRFPLGDRVWVLLGSAGVELDDIGRVLSPFSSSGQGAISRFGRRDPATFRGPDGAGVGVSYRFTDWLQGNIGYLAAENQAPLSESQGFFNGAYSAIAQLAIEPSDSFDIALAYTHTYAPEDAVNLMGATGSENANHPFGEEATSANHLGIQWNWKASPSVQLGGWFGYTSAYLEGGDGEATILNGALILALPGLLAEDNLGGIIIGVPPKVVQNDRDDEDALTSLHIEALYRIQVTDNLQITPGIFVITAPEHDDNDPIWVGTIRSRFSF